MSSEEFLNEDIREEYKKHRSVFRAARALGITLDRVKIAISEGDLENEEMDESWGRPEMRKYAVARKKVTDPWNNDDPAVKEARARLERGTHTMPSGRDGEWIILYSIPLAVPKPQPGYFRNGD